MKIFLDSEPSEDIKTLHLLASVAESLGFRHVVMIGIRFSKMNPASSLQDFVIELLSLTGFSKLDYANKKMVLFNDR